MRVGVLLPTYNREKYLPFSLESVLAQTYSDLEIIVIDNGSTDGTATYMASQSDSRIRYVVNAKNLGVIGSINRGITLFSPEVEWCTILGDDDLLEKDFIAQIFEAQKNFNARTILHGSRILIDEKGDFIRKIDSAPEKESALEYIQQRAALKRETFLTGVFFSRSKFSTLGGYPSFETGMATDDALIFSLALEDALYFVTSAVCSVRIHVGAESHEARGALRHVRALKSFALAVQERAIQSQQLSAQDLSSLNNSLQSYIRRLNSILWLRNAHTGMDLKELYQAVESKEFSFSFRVKCATQAHRLFGCNLESLPSYRFLWKCIRQLLGF